MDCAVITTFRCNTLCQLYQMPQAIIAHSQFSRDNLAQTFGVAGDKITVIPLGNLDYAPGNTIAPDQARQKLELPARPTYPVFWDHPQQ